MGIYLYNDLMFGVEKLLSEEMVLAMAIACIAEEEKTDISGYRVVSFNEIQKSSLEEYIEMKQIAYKKYQPGDELHE